MCSQAQGSELSSNKSLSGDSTSVHSMKAACLCSRTAEHRFQAMAAHTVAARCVHAPSMEYSSRAPRTVPGNAASSAALSKPSNDLARTCASKRTRPGHTAAPSTCGEHAPLSKSIYTRRPPVSMGNLLAASGFAAFAALVLAASIIFGLPGTEHAGGRGQVTGRISMVPPPLRH